MHTDAGGIVGIDARDHGRIASPVRRLQQLLHQPGGDVVPPEVLMHINGMFDAVLVGGPRTEISIGGESGYHAVLFQHENGKPGLTVLVEPLPAHVQRMRRIGVDCRGVDDGIVINIQNRLQVCFCGRADHEAFLGCANRFP